MSKVYLLVNLMDTTTIKPLFIYSLLTSGLEKVGMYLDKKILVGGSWMIYHVESERGEALVSLLKDKRVRAKIRKTCPTLDQDTSSTFLNA